MKKKSTRWISVLFTAFLLLTMTIPVFAEEPDNSLEQIPDHVVEETAPYQNDEQNAEPVEEPVAESTRTVLYDDGTLILNELAENRASNEAAHGAAAKEYPAWDGEENDYVFTRYSLWWSEKNAIRTIEIGSRIAPVNTANWFMMCEYTQKADLSNLDTSHVTDMTSMFHYFGYAVTASVVITGLDCWDTSKVTSTQDMFYYAAYKARQIEIPGFKNWDMSNVTSIARMFYEFGYNAETVMIDPLDTWNIGNVVTAEDMFYDFRRGSKGEATNIGTLFIPEGCNVSGMVNSADYINGILKFKGTPMNGSRIIKFCSNYNGGALYLAPTNSETNKIMEGIISKYGRDGTELKGYIYLLDDFIVGRTVLYEDGTLILNELVKNQEANEAAHGTVTKIFPAWDGAENDYVFGNTGVPWFNYRYDITAVEAGSKISPVDTSKWFFECPYAVAAELSKLDMSNVTNADQMFYNFGGMASEKDIVISGLETWDTGKLKNMHGMFMWVGQFARSVTITGFTNWDTSSAEDTSEMFEFAGRSAKAVNLSGFDGWNTGKIKATAKMFYGLGYDAESVSLSGFENWDTASLEDAGSMFEQCASSDKKSITMDLSKWDVSKAMDMNHMFSCFRISAEKVTLLGLANWKINASANLDHMFTMSVPTGLNPAVSEYNIGTLTIPGGCTINGMFDYVHNVVGTIKFTGMPTANYGTITFTDSANTAGGALYLAPTDDETLAFAEDTVAKYGLSGSVSQGHVYLLKMFDFTVSESIMMTGTADSADLEVTDLTVENLGSKAITVSSVQVDSTLNGWTLLESSINFASLPKNSKKFSLVIGGFDLSKGTYTFGGSIPADERKAFELVGRTGAVSAAVDCQQIASLIVTVEAGGINQ